MTHSHHERYYKVNDQVDDLNNGFCWGAEAIGAVIGRNSRQTHHLLTRGVIRSATCVELLWSAANRGVA